MLLVEGGGLGSEEKRDAGVESEASASVCQHPVLILALSELQLRLCGRHPPRWEALAAACSSVRAPSSAALRSGACWAPVSVWKRQQSRWVREGGEGEAEISSRDADGVRREF